MSESECIIAVNKNDTAPIFEIADYGICGDLFKVTPMLTEAIKAQKKTKDAVPVSREDYARIACETWLDVRAFGQVFAFKEDKKKK